MRALAALTAAVLAVTLGCSTPDDAGKTGPAGGPAPRHAPALHVSTLVAGLDIPWDVQAAFGGYLVTERDKARLSFVSPSGDVRRIKGFPSSRVWVSGETGLLSMAVDAGRHVVYACHGGFRRGGGHDVRVVAYTLDDAVTTVTGSRVVLAGFPATSGRHGGCRLLLDPRDGSLWVGTGDSASGHVPRSLRSLGGKILRLDPRTGRPWPTNPFRTSKHRKSRYIWNYGHRNVQGLALRSDGTLWSVEHGPDRDDEVNIVKRGRDYGWNPVQPGSRDGYNESVPMTDQSLPGKQVPARWRSGYPTLATSGASWVHGAAWGSYDGTLAVAALKASRLLFLRFDARGRFRWAQAPAALRQFGRLRSVTSLADGSLLVTTANGGDGDRLLRVSAG